MFHSGEQNNASMKDFWLMKVFLNSPLKMSNIALTCVDLKNPRKESQLKLELFHPEKRLSLMILLS